MNQNCHTLAELGTQVQLELLQFPTCKLGHKGVYHHTQFQLGTQALLVFLS